MTYIDPATVVSFYTAIAVFGIGVFLAAVIAVVAMLSLPHKPPPDGFGRL